VRQKELVSSPIKGGMANQVGDERFRPIVSLPSIYPIERFE